MSLTGTASLLKSSTSALTLSVPGAHDPKDSAIFDHSAMEVARVITQMDSEMFVNLSMAELVSVHWKKEPKPDTESSAPSSAGINCSISRS